MHFPGPYKNEYEYEGQNRRAAEKTRSARMEIRTFETRILSRNKKTITEAKAAGSAIASNRLHRRYTNQCSVLQWITGKRFIQHTFQNQVDLPVLGFTHDRPGKKCCADNEF
jgi:hypothetical protein